MLSQFLSSKTIFSCETILAGCLRQAGYAVIESESGEEALALCKSGMSIDMIVTDINLWWVGKRLGRG